MNTWHSHTKPILRSPFARRAIVLFVVAAVVPAAIFGVLTHLNVGLDSPARIEKLYPPLTVLTVFIGLFIGLVWVRRYIEEIECKGTIVEVDYSPLRTAAHQLADWHGRGFDTLIFKCKYFPTPNSRPQVVRSCAKNNFRFPGDASFT